MVDEFAGRLSGLRKESGQNQRTVASRMKISQALLSHYENGVREPGLEFVIKACAYYGVSADYLLGRTAVRDGSAAPDRAEERENELDVLKRRVTGTVSLLFDCLKESGGEEAARMLSDCLVMELWQVLSALPIQLDGACERSARMVLEQTLFDLATGSEKAPLTLPLIEKQYPERYKDLIAVTESAKKRIREETDKRKNL